MLWGKDDTFSRWLQLICALPLLAFGGYLEYTFWFGGYHSVSSGYLGFGSLLLGIRCLCYAVTGRNNINRELLNKDPEIPSGF